MADNETPTATSDSGAGDDTNQPQSASKLPAPKDRECQYCHQQFTSSSLGRHLDQYLSKKKPDGVHNIEEITRLRGGITRRQPKGTQPTKASSSAEEAVVAKDSPATLHCSPSADYLNGVGEAGEIVSLNTPIWQSTGVINGLPDPRIGTLGGTVQAINTPMTLKPNIPSLLNKEPPPEKETSRALELALREVLDNIKSARYYLRYCVIPILIVYSVRTAPKPSPFDFDFQAQTFPSLCLRLLPNPPTLFSSAPFATSESFPIDPPEESYLEPVRAKVSSIISQWKADRLSALNPKSQSATHTSSDATDIEPIARQHTEMANRHIQIAYSNWTKVDSRLRYQQWHMEILRAFARERSEREQIAERLQRKHEEATQLQAQVNFLNNCQWPREYALCPPSRCVVGKFIGTDGVRELNDSLSKETNTIGAGGLSLWDYDALVDKWRRVIRQEPARTNGTPIQQPPPAQIQTRPFSPINSGSHHRNIHTPNSHHHHHHPPPPHHHHHPYQPRPSSASTPPETPGSTGRPNDLPPAKRPRLEPLSATNGTRSEETSRPPYPAGSGARPGSGDRLPSLPAGTIVSGPPEAPFFGKRPIKEINLGP